MYTHSYAGFTIYAKKYTISNILTQHVQFEIAMYAKQSPIPLFEQFPARIY